MNGLSFDDLLRTHGAQLGQHPAEWRLYMEFLYAFFHNRRVECPVVVEIGTMNNVQRHFYKALLNAEHIGIDVAGNADIVGRSQVPDTLLKLATMLHGRMIDVLFIDGDHTYQGVKADYENYRLLVRHVIALHDISHPYSAAIPEETMRLWNEICATERGAALLSFCHYNSTTTGITAGRQMGIGLVVKG